MKIKEEKKTKSYLAILEASKHLFWKYGITRVTVEEICEQANVSKMTFYRNFENKLDVAEIILKQLADKGLSDYNDIMKLDIQFNEKIHRIVQMKYDNSENLSEDFIKDIYGAENPKLKNILSEARVKSSEALHKDFSNAQQSGEIRQDLKIDFVIYMINSLNEKMVDDRLTSMYGNTQELAVELTNFIFYGIMPRNN
ncbi:MAG: TetR/AcrR family transcriptional regulator [Maribacter litoralis]|uniref:TetR/AcrR family transcriptional regulator n=1 Tax=Maribacter litoralis TaxID=2059726 RepID=UPI003299D3A0